MAARSRSWVQQAFYPPINDIGQRVVNGAAFTFLGIAFRTAITLGSMAVLARLLTPKDFGHIAMATVLTELATVFANFGFGSILIQRLRISRIQIDTMHWSAIGLGCCLTIIVFGLSFATDQLFHDQTVGPLLRVLCISFVLEEFTMVPRSLLARRMLFKQDFYIQSGMMLVRAGTAIIMALNGLGVWSLAGGAIAGLTINAIAYTVITGYWPRMRFSTSFLKSTWQTNGSYFGNGLLFYVNSSIDFLLLGRMLGASMLGQYQNARSLTDEIHVRMVQPLQRVLFPAFSALQNDPARFREGILRSGRLLALVFTPMGFGVAAVAPELVSVLYGDQWLPMIPILQVIAIAIGLSAAATVGSPVFNATNQTGLLFKLYSIQTGLNITFMLIGSQWGVMGVAWSRLALVFVIVVFFRIALGLVQLNLKHVWQIMGPPIIAAILMWVVLGIARSGAYSWGHGTGSKLVCLIGLGFISYTACALIVAPRHVRDAMAVVVQLFSRLERWR